MPRFPTHDDPADLVINVPPNPPPPTLEERVSILEKKLAHLDAQISAKVHGLNPYSVPLDVED